jgi:hypothetical protein
MTRRPRRNHTPIRPTRRLSAGVARRVRSKNRILFNHLVGQDTMAHRRYCCACFALISLPVSQSLQMTVPFAGYVQTILCSCLF